MRRPGTSDGEAARKRGAHEKRGYNKNEGDLTTMMDEAGQDGSVKSNVRALLVLMAVLLSCQTGAARSSREVEARRIGVAKGAESE